MALDIEFRKRIEIIAFGGFMGDIFDLVDFVVDLTNVGGRSNGQMITNVRASSSSEARKMAESRYSGSKATRITPIPKPGNKK